MLKSRTGRAVLVVLAACLVVGFPGAAAGAADEAALESSLAARFEALRDVLGADGLAKLVSAAVEADAEDPATSLDAAAALPACEYRDKLTRFHKVGQFRKTLLDTNLRVKRSYKPWDLVPVSRANIKGTGSVRKVIIADLKAMARAARRAGKPLAVRSAYRSYATQVATFNSWVRRAGLQQALKFSARPGHSEHQMGTTIDFTTAPGQPLSSSFGNTRQGKWLARNAWKYGFINPYPKGKRKVSCYGYEPWHWRYVGRELARDIHESGLVPRRYFWRHFENAP